MFKKKEHTLPNREPRYYWIILIQMIYIKLSLREDTILFLNIKLKIKQKENCLITNLNGSFDQWTFNVLNIICDLHKFDFFLRYTYYALSAPFYLNTRIFLWRKVGVHTHEITFYPILHFSSITNISEIQILLCVLLDVCLFFVNLSFIFNI